MSYKLLIKNGQVIDPSIKLNKIADVLIENGKIAAVENASDVGKDNIRIIDAKDCIVSPGLIDVHTHLRQPGREDEETIESASRAAAKGGFTSITAMPNTDPPIDNSQIVGFVKDLAEKSSCINIEVAGAITKELAGRELSEMIDMKEAGAVFFTDDGKSVQDSQLMRFAMEYAKGIDLPLFLHCEDFRLSEFGQMNEGFLSTKYGLKGIPPQAEEIIIYRDLALAKLTGCKVHFTHLSTKNSVKLIRQAKKDGLNVTCDVTPHHIALTENDVVDYDANFKVNPPLRSEMDRLALIDGLIDGTIDMIATDHAPHAAFEKECEFDLAAFGVIGLETALGVVLTELYHKNKIEIDKIIEKIATNPAKIINKNNYSIRNGNEANLVIFNPDEKWVVDSNFVSRSKNSPFIGRELKGRVKYTIYKGMVVYEE